MSRKIHACVLMLLLSGAAPALQATQLDHLAEDPEWLALLHINQGATIHSRGESYVDDDNFFLAENGQVDRVAELSATVAALQPAGAEDRCRFPARYRLLTRMLGWQETETPAQRDYILRSYERLYW